MANHTIPDPPQYSEELRRLETTDPAHADVFNALFARLLENEAYLNEKVSKGGLVIGESPPENINALWIDTTMGGVAKYHNGDNWVPCAAVWG